MKAKTMREIVSELINKGHNITYRVRSDGGILITSIDGKVYKGASGNAIARSMAGEKLSEKRKKQLKKATKFRSQIKATKKDLREKWRETRNKWRERFPKGHPAGSLSWSRIQFAIDTYGLEEAYRRLDEAERYMSGLAYSKNVEHLIDMILDYATKKDSQLMITLAEEIRSNWWMIREEDMYHAYEALYKLNDGIPVEEVYKNVKTVLRI